MKNAAVAIYRRDSVDLTIQRLVAVASDRVALMIGEVRLTSAGRGVRAAVHLGRVRWTAIHFAVTELDVASDCIGYHWRVCRVLGCLSKKS